VVFVWGGRIRLLWLVLIFLLILLVIFLFIFRICYKAVESAGDKIGYARDLKEGQQKGPGVTDGSSLLPK
jgi:hypothetical protein